MIRLLVFILTVLFMVNSHSKTRPASAYPPAYFKVEKSPLCDRCNRPHKFSICGSHRFVNCGMHRCNVLERIHCTDFIGVVQ